MVTINDIAKMAGVAKSTVSRYLNGGSVSQKTKDKIDIIIKETGYVPNTFAQSLKMKNTNIGLPKIFSIRNPISLLPLKIRNPIISPNINIIES